MKPLFLVSVSLILCFSATAVFAYGSGSSSSSCHKPSFSEFNPSVNKYLQSFREFSFVASSNTVPTSIEVNISIGQVKHHFSAKELQISQKPSGQLEVSGKLDRPFQHGFVRINVTAHSKPGCALTDGRLIRVH
ncbi:MAG: hypothetical protein ACU85E_14995 [Gammaproteobacteria bacterium]